MSETKFHNRRAVSIENDRVRVTVLVEGGHVAEILDKASGVNPLWVPPWPSIEPSSYSPANARYGSDAEARLLGGIMGQNLCIDLFGGPTAEEAAAGMTVHGEASVAPYEISSSEGALSMTATFPVARLRFERELRLEGNCVRFVETLENLSAQDHPTAWTQHVTLGPPFVERGKTQFHAPIARSYLLAEEREIPAQRLHRFPAAESSGGFETHLMDPKQERAFFVAHSPGAKLAIAYEWKWADYPWLGVWEENCSRTQAPWNGETITWGMEFGASPIPESRRAMIGRNGLFGFPGYRWIPARSKVRVEYSAFVAAADSIPETPEELKIGISA